MSNISSKILQSILVHIILEKDDKIFRHTDGMYLVALMLMCYYEYGKAKHSNDRPYARWIAENELLDYDVLPNIEGYIKLGFKK